MNPGGFVSKQQYQAVYDHFREVVAKAEAEENFLFVEFNLLLDYFRTVHSDSERKSHKIRQLQTKVSQNEALLHDLDLTRAKETAHLSLQVRETKTKIDELVQKEHALLKQVDAMKATIKKLKALYRDEAEEKETDLKSFREIGTVTDEVREDFECKICSKKSREAINQALKEIGDLERREEVVLEVNAKVNALMTELKMAYKERDDLAEELNHYSMLLQESHEKLEFGNRVRRSLERHLAEKKSLNVTIDKLTQELNSKKCEVLALHEELKKEQSKSGACALECRSKEKYLEEMKTVLQAEKEEKDTLARKAEVLARHLATDRERREAIHGEVSAVKAENEELRRRMKDCEAHQRTMMVQMKLDEEHHRTKLQEHTRAVEQYEVQITSKNKKIETLLNKLSEAEKQPELLKKQPKSKKSTTTPITELERLRAELRNVNSAHRTAQCQLQTYKTTLENQLTKMERMKRAHETLLKEKNKFLGQCRALEAKMESQNLRTKFILNERDCHRKVLRAIDNQVEKDAKEAERNRVSFRF